MSLATLERAIVAHARTVLKNPKLRVKDLLAWQTTAGLKANDETDIVVKLPREATLDCEMWIVVPRACDKREAERE